MNRRRGGTVEKVDNFLISEFIREEVESMKSKGAPRNRQQAVAIALSRARAIGIKVPGKRKGR